MKTADHNTLSQILAEIQEQPPWRAQADREADYCDGNQADSELLKKIAERGVKPVIENVIGPAIRDITGMEAKTRTDLRVEPDGSAPDADAVAQVIGQRMHEAERQSGCDRACALAYSAAARVGLGWMEVSRNSNPFEYPYRVDYIHRNEIWWDWHDQDRDMKNARWLLRRRWTSRQIAELLFPKKKTLIEGAVKGWNNIDDISLLINDPGGQDTGLAMAEEIERGWTVEDLEWRTPDRNRVCLFHLQTRDWQQALVLKMPDGRVVELDEKDQVHLMAVSVGMPVVPATITRIYNHFFLGPHHLQTVESEFRRFSLVPVWCDREDRTAKPYGLIRWLMPIQDAINLENSKQRWMAASVRSVRTDGAVMMTDEVFRHEVGRPDSDIILSQEHMAKPGAKFEVQDGSQLTESQRKRLLDLREQARAISGVSAAFSGDGGADTASGLNALIEQTVQSLAGLNDNYMFARQSVGDLLLTMIINDIGDQQQRAVVKKGLLGKEQEIILNSPAVDPETGARLLTNDVQRTKLKVTLSDVPSTPSFRQQQLTALSEFAKALPTQLQAIVAPHLMHLANVPNKDEIVEAITKYTEGEMMSAEQVEAKIKEAVEAAKVKWMVEQKEREIDIKERKANAEIEKIVDERVNMAIEAIYSATQAGQSISYMPGVAPIADQVLKSAGFQDRDQPPIVSAPAGAMPNEQMAKNTSPMYPPRIQEPDTVPPEMPEGDGMQGAAVGINEGIESNDIV